LTASGGVQVLTDDRSVVVEPLGHVDNIEQRVIQDDDYVGFSMLQ
jgi:hypothetical protein